MHTHCVRGWGRGSGCCIRAHYFLNIHQSYLNLINFILYSNISILHKMIAWENDLLILLYVYHIRIHQIKLRRCVQKGGGQGYCVRVAYTGEGGLATFSVRTLWMAPK